MFSRSYDDYTESYNLKDIFLFNENNNFIYIFVLSFIVTLYKHFLKYICSSGMIVRSDDD